MNLCKLYVILFAVLVFLFSPSIDVNASNPIVTSTGFIYPTGKTEQMSDVGWLASGCSGKNNYFSGQYHIGHDFICNVGDCVYAISDGIVEYISYNGWGDNNVGVFIKHKLSDNSFFLALYGHITTSVYVGNTIKAGDCIGKIGSWPYGAHLHFGIIPDLNRPNSNYGLMQCINWPATNNFVNPINWITTKTPQNSSSTYTCHLPNGLYVVGKGGGTYYYIQDGKKRPINGGYLAGRKISLDRVITLSDDSLNSIPTGDIVKNYQEYRGFKFSGNSYYELS